MPNGCMGHLPNDDSFLTFFECSAMGLRVVPRLVMVDTEPTVIGRYVAHTTLLVRFHAEHHVYMPQNR